MNNINWRIVFKSWMQERKPLDRIDFADVPRAVGQRGWYEMDGPVVTVVRTFSGFIKERA